MLLQWCGEFDSVSDERLELKSHSSLYIFFSVFWGAFCLPPEPLTPSTSDLWINHIIKLYKPNGKKFNMLLINSYLISLDCHFVILHFCCTNLIRFVFFLSLSNIFLLFPSWWFFTDSIFNRCLLILSYYTINFQNFYILYTWKTSTWNTVSLH